MKQWSKMTPFFTFTLKARGKGQKLNPVSITDVKKEHPTAKTEFNIGSRTFVLGCISQYLSLSLRVPWCETTANVKN
jgi:hypothetical protein